MPVILHPENEDAWLNPENQDVSELMSMLIPYPHDQMEAFEVSDFVNSPSNQGPLCIKPANPTLLDFTEEVTAPSGSM